MRVLILGHKGNLGSQLYKKFIQDKSFNLIGLDKEDLDVLDFKLLFSKINEIKPNIIINTVAYNNVDECERETGYKMAEKLNIDLVENLVKLAQKHDAILVHYSTDYVFGGGDINAARENNGFRETDKPNPINKYGETKMRGEGKILEKKENLKFYLIRPSKLFGPKGESEISKPSFFEIILNLATKKDAIDVIDEEESCFTYTPDLAEATFELIKEKYSYGIYHLINEGSATWYGGARALFQARNIKTKINPCSSLKFSRLAKRPEYSVLANTKFRQLRNFLDSISDFRFS